MKYKTVVIDPPWPIEYYSTKNLGYDTMTLEQIQEFPIDKYADSEKCLLFLWAINRVKGRCGVQVAAEILNYWGFSYHILLVWDKQNQQAVSISPFLFAVDYCLVGYRGPFEYPTHQMKNIIHAPRTKNSEKPVKFYQLLRSWTPAPRIDLFARQVHEGFDGWGNEYAGEHGPLLPFLEESNTEVIPRTQLEP